MIDELARLRAERDALSTRIALMEDGVRRAAYDASMQSQLIAINEARKRSGKPPLTMAQFLSGDEGEYME